MWNTKRRWDFWNKWNEKCLGKEFQITTDEKWGWNFEVSKCHIWETMWFRSLALIKQKKQGPAQIRQIYYEVDLLNK